MVSCRLGKGRMVRKKKVNPYISFYGRHGISPVHQDISDLRLHLMRREKLYRSLGLPTIAFSGKRIVEIGPGGGYNALAFFAWGAHVDFVEPNQKAQDELPKLLSQYKVKKKQWRLFPCTVENFTSTSCYEVVVAEGFIPGLYERKRIVSKLRRLVMPGGIIVVTCVDELSFLFELIKRMIGRRLIWQKKVKDFDDRIALLSRAFASHLRSLKFASRPVKDWVTEIFFNPAAYGKFFNIAECITEFGEEFELLGTSPDMFTDYSWYKDVSSDRRRSILDQYAMKRHILMWHKMGEKTRPVAANNILAKKAGEFRILCEMTEEDFGEKGMGRVTAKLNEIINLTRDLGPEVSERLCEGIRFLENKNLNEKNISQSAKLASAFGRCQQYVSLVRKTA